MRIESCFIRDIRAIALGCGLGLRLSVAVVFVLLFCQKLHAGSEEETRQNRLWFNFGLGRMEVSNESRITYILSANYQSGIHLLTLRQIGLAFPEIYSEYDDLDVLESALLYGFNTESGNSHSSISAGPSFAILEVLEREDGLGFETDRRWGLALGAQAFWQSFDDFWVGLHGFGNINSVENIFGFTVNLQFVF